MQAERESARGVQGQSKADDAPQSLGQELHRRGQGLARDLSSRQQPPSTPSAGKLHSPAQPLTSFADVLDQAVWC